MLLVALKILGQKWGFFIFLPLDKALFFYFGCFFYGFFFFFFGYFLKSDIFKKSISSVLSPLTPTFLLVVHKYVWVLTFSYFVERIFSFCF